MIEIDSLNKKLCIHIQEIPTILTLSRLCLTPILYMSILEKSPYTIPIYLAACMTDLFDGRIARTLCVTSKLGEALDAVTDFIIIFAGYTYYVLCGFISPILLVVMSVSILQYLLTIKMGINDVFGRKVGTILYISLFIMLLIPSKYVGDVITGINMIYITASMINRFMILNKKPE